MSESTSRRSSFLGTIKGKLSRRNSNASQKSGIDPGGSPRSPVPALAPNNPFASAPATRRPREQTPRNEAPPPYSEAAPATAPPPGAVAIAELPSITYNRSTSPAPSARSGLSVQSMSRPEDPYAFLSSFDTIFLIDDSGSMAGRSWREVKTVLANIAPICTAHDEDGIDVYFLNHRSGEPPNPASGRPGGGYTGITSEERVEELFSRVRPTAMTPTGRRITDILNPYINHFGARLTACGGDEYGTGVKPINVIVITDGVADDDPETAIADMAAKLDRLHAPSHQVGLQFFQVGAEPEATEELRRLDDAIGASGVRDMVDTVTWDARDGSRPALTAEAILKVVLGAVVKRLDRQTVGAAEPNSRHLNVRR